MQDSEATGMSILYLMHTNSLSTFDPNLSGIVDERDLNDEGDLVCGLRSSERLVTHFLFWGLMFLSALIMLNALIAIMNNTYNTLQAQWDQQIKKTWAEITSDVISNWPKDQRARWEKKFYWLHLVGPSDAETKPAENLEDATAVLAATRFDRMDDRLTNLKNMVELLGMESGSGSLGRPSLPHPHPQALQAQDAQPRICPEHSQAGHVASSTT
jgi:hypothetical protein